MAALAVLDSNGWLDQQVMTMFSLITIEDCAIAVDARYFLERMLVVQPAGEPLVAALGGLTGISGHLNNELDRWAANRVTPLFVFDGLPMRGEDDETIAACQECLRKTKEAWALYFSGNAASAVESFGATHAYRAECLFPLLQKVLRKRKLHYIVAPYKAAAQIAYLDMIDSDQVAGILGSKELLCYPIRDAVIRSIDWDVKTVVAYSKDDILKSLKVSEPMFIDALLMLGTSFLPAFPPLVEESITHRQPPSITDAINMLNTVQKNVVALCNTYNDVLRAKDADWLDKFQRARMFLNHFIYIAESGEVMVHNRSTLTPDHFEFLGFQLPAELFHYLDKGLIGPRLLSAFSHKRVSIMPTLDGHVSGEYRELVTEQLVPHYETALRLLVGRLNRGFKFGTPIFLRVWYDSTFARKLELAGDGKPPEARISKWKLTPELVAKYFPQETSLMAAGSVAFEVGKLADQSFVEAVLETSKVKRAETKNLASADAIVSLVLWKLLTLRGYVADDTLSLTPWGTALAASLTALEPVARAHAVFAPTLSTAALLGWELIRLGLLSSRHQHQELQGLPINGSSEDKDCVVLISRVASLLQLRQNEVGYTGPLNKNLLAFRSLALTVAEAERTLIDSVLAYTFVTGEAERERDDLFEIGHRLPYWEYPDVALGVAVKTYLDETHNDKTPEAMKQRRETFPATYLPHAPHLLEDVEVAFGLFEALYAGVASLGSSSELDDELKAQWERAHKYLERRKQEGA